MNSISNSGPRKPQTRMGLVVRLLRGGIRDVTIVCNLLELRRWLNDASSILDIGCGPASPVRFLEIQRSVGLEGHAPSLEQARKNATHSELVGADARDLERLYRPGEFDAVVALDVIEHLHKEDGLKMIAAMERAASGTVLLFTPNGFLPQFNREAGELQEHLSGWDAAEMKQRGFHVVGMLGPKKWRGEGHALKFRPRWFWGLASLLTHFLWTRRHPEAAAAILCVKCLQKRGGRKP